MITSTPTGSGGSSPSTASKSKLVDLVKFEYDGSLGGFIKKETLLTNVPKAIAYAKKKSLLANRFYVVQHRGLIRLQVCPNGTYQYRNKLLTRKSK